MLSRRQLLGAGGAGLLAYSVAGSSLLLSPAQAREQSLPLRVLSTDEVATLEMLSETIAPGASEAGIAWFLDFHLSSSPEQSLLMLRYLGVPPPYIDFYRPCLQAIEQACKQRYGASIKQLSSADKEALIRQISTENPEGWLGPPAPFFYFVLRSDAIDLVYGTRSGFEQLEVPYMAHIAPTSDW